MGFAHLSLEQSQVFNMRMLGTTADKLKFAGGEVLLEAAQHKSTGYFACFLCYVSITCYLIVSIIKGDIQAHCISGRRMQMTRKPH